jgi:hypothetical protein
MERNMERRLRIQHLVEGHRSSPLMEGLFQAELSVQLLT